MLVEAHIEALLLDPDLADQVWELRAAGVTRDREAAILWTWQTRHLGLSVTTLTCTQKAMRLKFCRVLPRGRLPT